MPTATQRATIRHQAPAALHTLGSLLYSWLSVAQADFRTGTKP